MKSSKPVPSAARAVAAVMLLMTSLLANATVIWEVNANGQLTSAQNVDVFGTGVLYDVEFSDGTCIAVFSGCDELSDFTFMNGTDAYRAAQSLLDQVFLDIGGMMFDTDPNLTFGCGPAVIGCAVISPYSFDGARALYGLARNSDGFDSAELGEFGVDVDFDLDRNRFFTWARWTLSTPVPEPGTLAMLGLGLGAVTLARRRKRQ